MLSVINLPVKHIHDSVMKTAQFKAEGPRLLVCEYFIQYNHLDTH